MDPFLCSFIFSFYKHRLFILLPNFHGTCLHSNINGFISISSKRMSTVKSYNLRPMRVKWHFYSLWKDATAILEKDISWMNLISYRRKRTKLKWILFMSVAIELTNCVARKKTIFGKEIFSFSRCSELIFILYSYASLSINVGHLTAV